MINLIFDIDDTVYDQLKPFENAFKTVFEKRPPENRKFIY